jgi:hypothetical protein
MCEGLHCHATWNLKRTIKKWVKETRVPFHSLKWGDRMTAAKSLEFTMALTLHDMSAELYEQLQQAAEQSHCSIEEEAIRILKAGTAKTAKTSDSETTKTLLSAMQTDFDPILIMNAPTMIFPYDLELPGPSKKVKVRRMGKADFDLGFDPDAVES